MLMKKLLFSIIISLNIWGNPALAAQPERNVTRVTFGGEIVNHGYIGNGAQWDP